VGPYLADFLRVGSEFGPTTISRFYALHMLLVPVLIAALIGARRVAGPVGELTAAARAVEDASYDPGTLDRVAGRRDEIGRLAQVFDRMAREVREREERMRRKIKQLSVQIDEAKRREQVAEITETDYFRDLQQRARKLRGRGDGEEG